MDRSVGIIGGCGHVGLPLAIALAPHHQVCIYDVDSEAVERVKRGEVPFRDEGAPEGLQAALASGMRVTTSPQYLSSCDILVIVIGTPVDKHLNPSFDLFDKLLLQLAEVLQSGQTLVLRSTVYPGTSARANEYFLRRGIKIHVAFCPERVAEGMALKEIRNLPQIVSGFTPEAVAAARSLFAPLGVELLEVTPLEAELTKLFTNVYRYITFSVANQFYMMAAEWDIDFSRILHAMKHHYPRAAAMPGPGFTAGPCLFKDTMQMSAFNNNQFFLGHSAMLVNEGLPKFVVNRMRKHWPNLDRLTVGILGMAFKAESDDSRESLSYKLKKILSLYAGRVLTSDPYVSDGDLRPEKEVLETSDLLVLGVPHQRYKTLDYKDKPVIDVWNHLGRGSKI